MQPPRWSRWVMTLIPGVILASSVQSAELLRFAVMMHVMKDAADDAELRTAFDSAQTGDPSFIVVNGMRSVREPCTEQLYRQRAALFFSSPYRRCQSR